MSSDNLILPNEYISSEDTTAYVIIDTDLNGNGTILGGGEYAKGDSVELTAIPDNDNYEFNGWYIGDEFVSADNIYCFTAIKNTDVHAEFVRVYNNDNAYDMQISDTAQNIYSYIYKDFDYTRGIVIVPFGENVEDDMQIYVTTYGADNAVLSSDIPYSTALNENGIYAFENIDLENASKVVIYDENKEKIASSVYDSSGDITDKDIFVCDKYGGRLTAYVREGYGSIALRLNILDNTISPNNISAYLVRYNENSELLSCMLLEATVKENVIEYDCFMADNSKIVLWDGNMCPLTEVINSEVYEQ
ncbi:MAG: hypothetical protein PUF72_08165 [Clostridiales bacterium]|nr:hypothetical protein [Clostridiales bacterium]